MDLRLRCVAPSATFDVALEVEPSDSVSDLGAAVVSHARSLGLEVDDRPDLAVVGRPLDPADTVFSSGIATGDEVVIGGVLGEGDGRGFAVRVLVVSGPDAGAMVLLGPGRHTIGRDPLASVPLTDAGATIAHAHLDVRTDAVIRVVSMASDVEVDHQVLDGSRQLASGSVVRVGSSALEVSVVRRDRQTHALGTVAHNRTPHRRPVVHPRELEALDTPPEVATKPRFVLASALVPVASGAMLVIISGRVQFLFLVLLSPVLMVWSFLQDRRSGRRRYDRDRSAYLDAVDGRLAAGACARADELIERRRAAPTAAVLAKHAEFLQPRLWERDRTTHGFGELRVGVARVGSEVNIEIAAGGDHELVTRARGSLAELATLADAPVTVEFEVEPVVAIVGDEQTRHATARSMLGQAAALHSPEDLALVAMVSGSALSEYEWLKWLPHVRSSSSPLAGPCLAMWPDEQERLLVELANLAEERASGSGRADRSDAPWPRVLVLIDEGVAPERTVLSRTLDRAKEAGIWVLWVGASSGGIPRQADVGLHCGGAATPSVLDRRETARPTVEVDPDQAEVGDSLALARSLAPLRDATSASQIAALPRLVSLSEVVPGGRLCAKAIVERWSRDRGDLAAGVGIGSDGVHTLDLVAQGPHALIAGTSGAGKSEFLQTWVATLAAAHPPDRLNFLFIDYKGGAFSAPFIDLPHTVGTVTNLDESLSLRALTSLRAELDRRMALLGGVAKDVAELAAIDPASAPPRLVIIVDEFATLVKEIPDFVAGMVDLAQRGRSLGIHLVLATQRPSGSVNDDILANTNLRICLRVLDPADSTGVIGAPDASELPAPLRGRAYVRTGPGQLQPFQGAFAGAPDVPAAGPGRISTGSFDFSDVLWADAGMRAGAGTGRTQLDGIVAAIADAAVLAEVDRPRRPWLAPLPDRMTLTAIERASELRAHQRTDPGRFLTLGLADRPDRQVQDSWTVDLEASGGLLVFGGGGSGRTTVLRSVAAELSLQATRAGATIHVIDAAGRALGSLAALPSVSSVLSVDDLEPIARLIQVLEHEVDERRRVLADASAESLSVLRSLCSAEGLPRVVLLIDGLNGLREALDSPDTYDWFNRLIRLVAAGRQVGVHVVATADRRAGLPSSLVGFLGSRLVLPMSDADEAISMGVPRAVASTTDAPPGRGFADGVVVQVAIVGDDPDGPGQARAISALAAASVAARAAPLPELPDRLLGSMRATDDLVVTVGESDLLSQSAVVDLAAGHLIITGPGGSGRSTVAAGIARAVAATARPTYLIGIGGSSSPLIRFGGFDDAAFARVGHAEVLEALAATVDLDAEAVRAVVIVDATEDVSGTDTDRALERLSTIASVRLVVVADTATLARSFSGWVAEVRRSRRILLLRPESKADIDAVLGLRVPLRPGQPFPIGRGLLARGGAADLVQTYCENG